MTAFLLSGDRAAPAFLLRVAMGSVGENAAAATKGGGGDRLAAINGGGGMFCVDQVRSQFVQVLNPFSSVQVPIGTGSESIQF